MMIKWHIRGFSSMSKMESFLNEIQGKSTYEAPMTVYSVTVDLKGGGVVIWTEWIPA